MIEKTMRGIADKIGRIDAMQRSIDQTVRGAVAEIERHCTMIRRDVAETEPEIVGKLDARLGWISREVDRIRYAIGDES